MTSSISATQILVVILLVFVLANLSQVLVIDVGSNQWGSSIPSKDEFFGSYISEQQKEASSGHAVAGLNCEPYGGPHGEAAEEMVYWRDIPSDAIYQSPLKAPEEQFLTFEPDEGGWNNIRMAMETSVVFALATGRTLVLPPEQKLYLLGKGGKEFSFHDFFHFNSIEQEYPAFKVITFEEFLQNVAMKGQLKDIATGQVSFPPDNVTDWSGGHNWHSARTGKTKDLWSWVRSVVLTPDWQFDKCIAAFPSERGDAGKTRLYDARSRVFAQDAKDAPDKQENMRWQKRVRSYFGHPTPVDASAELRMREILAERTQLCVYDEFWQNKRIIHLQGEQKPGESHRMLIHFYAFFLFEDYRMDLWAKRFVRDHLRYLDEIQCAAARVVESVRQIARTASKSSDGSYDSMHIRRGDFQYKEMHMSAEELYANNTSKVLEEGRTVFIATDETSGDYFDPLTNHYHVLFLKNFKQELGDLNPNYYGMVDQLVASRGQMFFGAYFSTFTGYINRIRGYHAQKQKGKGFEQGAIDSIYYTPEDSGLKAKRLIMRSYHSIKQAFWAQEFPIAWRDIDFDVDAAAMVQ